MALQLITTTAITPPLVVIHGQEGVGKTTIASCFPKPVFLQLEDGCPAGLEIQSFGLLGTFYAVRTALSALATEEHDRRTVVIDNLDSLEAFIWNQACQDNGWTSIETPGYGKGYIAVEAYWLDILAAVDYLRRQRGMIVVLLAHSAIETINDPRAPSYTSYQLRIHKRARGLVQDRADVIAFLASDIHVQSEDQGFNRKRNRAGGDSSRWLHLEARPSFTAKNRYSMPAKIAIPKNLDYGATLAPYFPGRVGNEEITRHCPKRTKE
jgi:hypothetical protein